MLAPPAHAQLQPDTGTTAQVGGLRQQLEGLLAPGGGPSTAPDWTIVPALGIEQRWTDHLEEAGGSGNAAFITALLPSVLINGQTLRSSTIVAYSPALQYYSDNGDQNRITQNLNAISRLTLVPELLFLDLRAFAAMQPINGGTGPGSTVAVARQSETQAMSFSVHPYLRERFGDLGFAELGATVSHTSQDALSTGGTTGSGQSLFSQQEYLLLKSGPDLGRTSIALSITAGQGAGAGAINDSSSDEAKLSLGYAITRSITALASLGYDTLHYGGTPPYNQAGIEWSAGLRWEPNADSSIVATYGRQDGVDSAQLNASYAPTARTRVYARYSEGIITGPEQLLNAMDASALDPSGNPIGLDNGTPQQIVNSFYSVQSYLALVTSASVTAVLLQDRDSFSASLGRQERHQLAAATTATTGPQDYTGLYGSLNWQHDLRPNLRSFLFAQWGTTQSSSAGQSSPAGSSQNYDTLVFSLHLSYSISETLTAYAQYSWTNRGEQAVTGAAGTLPGYLPTNLIIIGARKTF